MSNGLDNASHKSSRTRSSSREPTLQDVAEEMESDEAIVDDSDSTSSHCAFFPSFLGAKGNNMSENERTMEIPGYNRQAFSRREILKVKLKYHFMNPWQKYKARNRKPWKLFIQILKIIIVTVQVVLFGTDRFSVVEFLEENNQALEYLFLKDWNMDSSLSSAKTVYTRDAVISYLHYAHEKYYNVHDAVGSYDYTSLNSSGEPPPVKLCYKYYKNITLDPSDNSFIFDSQIIKECQYLPNPEGGGNHVHYITNQTFTMGRLLNIELSFTLDAINLKGVRPWDRPACFALDVSIIFDNTKLDGQMPISLAMQNRWLKCKVSAEITSPNEEVGYLISVGILVYDVVVIIICLLSLILCLISLYKSLHLAKETRLYFKEEDDSPLTLTETMDLFNLWFIVIIVSDLLTILGSIYKIAIEQKDREYFDVCSLLLGIAVLLVWCGLLRFLEYFEHYNTLLVTVKASGPSVLRFCICSGVLFLGFTLCGWIVLGPHHPKFRDTTITAECLYSLINGDDMYNTYAMVNPKSEAIWIYSKLYLYVFIALFIYVVLSLFIGIIGDTYERLKDMGHLPVTRLHRFIANPHKEPNDDTTPTTSAATPGRTSSSSTDESMMRRVSMESTGVE